VATFLTVQPEMVMALMKKFGLPLLIAAISLLVVSVAISVKAEQPTKWACAFTTTAAYRGGNEEDRDPSLFKVAPEKFELTFLVVGTKGYAIGNVGSSEVAMVATDKGGLQFVERVQSGALQVTAIDIHGNAVHSRHTVWFDGVLLGEQHYGKCRQL
jgi:hypothetical protein